MRFDRGLRIVTRDAEALRVRRDIEAALRERHDVIADRGDCEATPGAEGLLTGQLVLQPLQSAPTDPGHGGCVVPRRAPMHETGDLSTRGTRARR